MNIIVEMLNGDRKWINLPEPQWQGECPWMFGQVLEAVFVGDDQLIKVVQLYDCRNEKSKSPMRTRSYCIEVDNTKYLCICDMLGITPTGIAAERG